MTYKIQQGYILTKSFGNLDTSEGLDLSPSGLLIGTIEASNTRDNLAAGNKVIYVAKGTFTILLNGEYKKIIPTKNIVSIKDENEHDY